MSLEIASTIRNHLWRLGVSEYVVAAGARNAPFVKVLMGGNSNEPNRPKTYQFFDERAAAFFALGRARALEAPVAVVTTSGTAVAELLPAAIEAFYEGLPLVLLTADRPKRYRGSGSPQSIEQAGLFGKYAKSYDLEGKSEVEAIALDPVRATHINVCFDEPLIGGRNLPFLPDVERLPVAREERSFDGTAIRKALDRMKRPIAIVSGLSPRVAPMVRRVLALWNIPLYIEAPSQLRDSDELAALQLRSGDVGLKHLVETHGVDGVIRIGAVPTVRLWRDIEEKEHLQVVSFSDLEFSGLSWQKEAPFPLAALKEVVLSNEHSDFTSKVLASDRILCERLEQLFWNYSAAEASQMRHLSQVIPKDSLVFIGNSLPIRKWDLAADGKGKNFSVFANRGANGIDGLISTFLGMSREESENWIILGDLSALYDMNALGLVSLNSESFAGKKLRIVVINNRGGKIFNRIFKDPNFENRHEFDFSRWAQFFGWSYQCVADADEIAPQSDRQIIEVAIEGPASDLFWSDYLGAMCLS